MAVETTQISADISVETKASLENTLRSMGG